MKVKEYPPSIARLLRLSMLTEAALKTPAKKPAPVVISMTAIASRLKVLPYTLRSLLNQTAPAEKIVLWLNPSLRDAITPAIRKLVSDRFEIRFREDVGPHTKLIYALEEFPDQSLVTADDDLLYDSTWLQRLIEVHHDHPKDIIGHQCRVVTRDGKGTLLPYKDWTNEVPGQSSPGTLALGYGGVLYPPRSLHPDARKPELFRHLAPKADDLWFKAMAVQQGTQVRRSRQPGTRPYPVPFSQAISLKKNNVRQDGNLPQWQALEDHFKMNLG